MLKSNSFSINWFNISIFSLRTPRKDLLIPVNSITTYRSDTPFYPPYNVPSKQRNVWISKIHAEAIAKHEVVLYLYIMYNRIYVCVGIDWVLTKIGDVAIVIRLLKTTLFHDTVHLIFSYSLTCTKDCIFSQSFNIFNL